MNTPMSKDKIKEMLFSSKEEDDCKDSNNRKFKRYKNVEFTSIRDHRRNASRIKGYY